MKTLIDTSALYALLDEDDRNHRAAARWLSGPGADPSEILVSHNYIVVESAALVHARLGAAATRVLFEALIPALTMIYVDEMIHERAVAGFLAGVRRRVSFVDRVSFEVIRDQAIDQAFAFDRDFVTEGFRVVP